MSQHMTGSLWPYSERKNLSVFSKKTFTVLSINDTASSSLSDPLACEYRTHSTSSVILSVRVCTRHGRMPAAPAAAAPAAAPSPSPPSPFTSNIQNLTF